MRSHVQYFAAVLLTVLLFAFNSLSAQEINQIQITPSPACVGEAVTFVVDGTGACNDVTVVPGAGLPELPVQSGALPLQFLLPNGYDSIGTYQVGAKSDNCNVSLPGGSVTLQVNSCRPQAGPVDDQTIGPRTAVTVAVANIATELSRLNPVITAGPIGGPIQPGNDSAILVLGHYFPRQGEGGSVVLIGPWGQETLEVLIWNPARTGVVFRVPDTIGGYMDQQALIVVRTAEGLTSNWLPVSFVAARETRTLSQGEVELQSCSTSSDVDCCNDFYDADVIQWFCPTDPGASFSGFHMTQWGMPRDDLGIDKYRVELKNGWVIDNIAMDVDQEEGESWARSISSDPKGSATWTEEIAWLTSPNDEVFYRATITVVGPRGVPHK